MARLSDHERYAAVLLCIQSMEARGRMPRTWASLLAEWGRDDLSPDELRNIVEEDLCMIRRANMEV